MAAEQGSINALIRPSLCCVPPGNVVVMKRTGSRYFILEESGPKSHKSYGL